MWKGIKKDRDFSLFLPVEAFSLGATGRLYVAQVMLYESEIGSVEEEYVTKLERDNRWMVRWIWDVRHENRIVEGELSNRLNLNNIGDGLHKGQLYCWPN